MRIVHICTSPKGGAGKAAVRLHNGLNAQSGIKSFFLHRDKSCSDRQDGFVYCPVPEKSLIDRAFARLGLLESAEQQKKRLLNGIPKGEYEIISFPNSDYRLEEHEIIRNADIIHLHWVSNFLNYDRFFKAIRKPIVWTLHDMNPFMGIFHYEGDLQRNTAVYQKLESDVLRMKMKSLSKIKSMTVVGLSNWLMQSSMHSLVLGSFDHQIIPNGIDFSLYPLLNRQAIAQKLGIDNEHKTLLFISEDIRNYRKGNDLLTNALSKIDSRINLITIGRGEIEVPPQVTLYKQGRIDDETRIHELYSAADLIVLPSREDNLPNVMLEAFVAGTPILSFKTGGMQDWIIPGVNGFFAGNISSESLALAIKDFCNNKYAFSQEHIRKEATKTFSIDKQTQQYLELYKKIVH